MPPLVIELANLIVLGKDLSEQEPVGLALTSLKSN